MWVRIDRNRREDRESREIDGAIEEDADATYVENVTWREVEAAAFAQTCQLH